ncbi:hypothetical protein I3842_06G054300 [Carya illinoinensis]|uniref:Uncharacterized protein n=1 Tax=Carya illinoinensis TaxID=32201 RepID=A0A922EPT4_CARIL|nr:hypothetical protein I3842_06G054300 [Carya illinoinensis]
MINTISTSLIHSLTVVENVLPNLLIRSHGFK